MSALLSSILPKPLLVTQVTDCHDLGEVSGGLAAAKVVSGYASYGARSFGRFWQPNVQQAQIIGSLPFNTIDAGAKAADFYHGGIKPHNIRNRVRHILAVNAAPPSSDDKGVPNNERENMVVGTLYDGTIIGGTIKGYALSYLKPEIDKLFEVANTHDVLRILYGDLYHDGMRQFRSNYLLTHLLLDYARHELRAYDLQALDVGANVPDPLAQSHVATIDNFCNIKLWLSAEDQVRLDEAVASSQAEDVPCQVSFGRRSLEAPIKPAKRRHADWKTVKGVLTRTMFSQAVGTNVLSGLSSSRHGARVLPQLCTLQSLRQNGANLPQVSVGAPVRFNFGL